jgi:monofunctional biosynthetic peptidoglycan transglycosylase
VVTVHRRRRSFGGRLGRVLIALVAFPYMYATVVYLTLPDVRPLATKPPATTAFMELRARQAKAEGRPVRRVQYWLPYSRISPHLTRAVLIAEDSAFFEHDGIDFVQLRESIQVNLERLEFSRGASTITQQLAKNLYLSPSKNPFRKFRELLITRMLEGALTKRRILELYLNVIEWGDGVYGADAAARTYFRVSASALSPEQAALLAGAIINPRVYSPAAPPRRLLARQQLILRRMGVVARAPKTAAPAQTAPAQAPAGPSTEVELPSEEQKTPANPGENEESDGGAADALAERTRIR